MTELPNRTPAEFDIDGKRFEGFKHVTLGVNADETISKLPAYVDIGGVHVHPSRVEAYLAQQQALGEGKKISRRNSGTGVMGKLLGVYGIII